LKDLNWVNFYENKSGGLFVLNNQASIGIYFSYLRKLEDVEKNLLET